jgi:hypothetical protein
MKKIISLFKRDYEGNRQVYNEVVPGAEWVIEGEGVATEKIDGTCCMVRDGKLYKRYDAKQGKKPPENWEAAQDPDPISGHWPGWLPVGEGPEDQWFREGLAHTRKVKLKLEEELRDGTYELIGPKIQGNPYSLDTHGLVLHGELRLYKVPPRDFDGLRGWLETYPEIEGIVWHHPDGRMVKIKRKDFGLRWPPK